MKFNYLGVKKSNKKGYFALWAGRSLSAPIAWALCLSGFNND